MYLGPNWRTACRADHVLQHAGRTKFILLIHRKYFTVYGRYAKNIQPYSENTLKVLEHLYMKNRTKIGLFAVHKIVSKYAYLNLFGE
jgi:hypothetical protein